MRKIKFRAWDEVNKVMHYNFKFIDSGDSSNDWIIFISNKFTLENHETNPFKNPSPYFSQQLKKMQYTGLKDKKGVEIYEGDVVKTKNSRYKVIFDKCCFWGVDELGKYPIYQIFHYVLDDEKFEVIGNIYENKELLDV